LYLDEENSFSSEFSLNSSRVPDGWSCNVKTPLTEPSLGQSNKRDDNDDYNEHVVGAHLQRGCPR